MAFRTQRNLERLTLPAGKAEVFHFDGRCPGLSVRIQRAGKPAFVVWYTAGGKRKRITLGAVAGMDLDQARRRATEIVNAARDGRDPSQERRRAQQAAATVLTVESLVRCYLVEYAAGHHRAHTLVDTRRYLERDWAPLHGLSAADVTRRDVSAHLHTLARSRGVVAANRARGKLSSCFSWGLRVGLVDSNPTIGTVKGEETARDRVLSIEELRALWCATADLHPYDAIIRHPYDAIIRLLLLTGQRRSEIGGMAHAEIDRDRRLWVVPGQRVKNGRSFELPLSRQAWEIIAEFPELPRCPYIFSRRGQAPFSGWSRCKARLDARLAEQQGAPLAAWTVHDLRRTFATLAAEHGLIEPFHIEAILNHVSGHRNGVAGTYNKAVYREQKRIGLQRWADWLEPTVAGRAPASNVVALGA